MTFTVGTDGVAMRPGVDSDVMSCGCPHRLLQRRKYDKMGE